MLELINDMRERRLEDILNSLHISRRYYLFHFSAMKSALAYSTILLLLAGDTL